MPGDSPIHWLVQSLDACPELKKGAAPVGLLSTGEQARLNTLKIEKRRRDWLLGRWTAKHLLQSVLCHHGGVLLPLDRLSLLNDPDGVPIVAVEGDFPFSLSISHSCDTALCALVERSPWPIGCDIERIAPRSETFVHDYLTADEIARVNCTASSQRDMMITAVWSAKESTLKALHLGLSVDPYAVTCLIDPVPGFPRSWTPFDIRFDTRWIGDVAPSLAGWWKPFDGFVLTIVCGKELAA